MDRLMPEQAERLRERQCGGVILVRDEDWPRVVPRLTVRGPACYLTAIHFKLRP